VVDTSRFLAAQCSRRAGKTNGLGFRFFRTLAKHPKALCLYIALTRESAYNIMWPILQEMNEKYLVGCTFKESSLTMTHPNGARLQLFGADMQNFIRRLKGIKTPGVAIDEAQDFGSHLQNLVDDVLTPTLTDYEDSWLALTGTPGPIPLGYFYDVTFGNKGGFSKHLWTLLDNPYLPKAASFIAELMVKQEWDENNPTLQREWRNKWVLDKQSLLIKYDEAKNHYEELPNKDLIYILGVDIGYRDADALAVIAWSGLGRDIHLVYENVQAGWDITSLSNEIEELLKRFDICKVVMDEGGLGKKMAEELRRRKSLPIQPADKMRKMENIAFLNEWLRLGKFKAKKDSRFAQDSYKLQIDWEKTTPDKIVVKDTFHSDIIDAVLYAFKESPAWTYQAPKVLPKYGSKEWADAEAVRMEEAAEDYFEQQEQMEDMSKWI
jgi:hypothetical protein